MTVADELNAVAGLIRAATPKDWQPYTEADAKGGEAITTPFEKPVTNYDDLMRDRGIDPEVYQIVGEVRTSQWQRYDGGWLYAYRFRFAIKMENIDLPSLFSAAKKLRFKPTAAVGTGAPLIVVWADPQTGKSGGRGGTAELIVRIGQKMADLEAQVKKRKPSVIYFLDAGDGVENFENVAGQMFTNDLSLPDQVDIEATFEFNAVAMLAKYAKVVVVKVPSNHGQWRRGKGVLGKPTDDWGIHIGKRLKQMTELLELPVEYAFPREWDESIAVKIEGTETIIGMHHGHFAARPDAIPATWAGHVHGGQALAAADILVTGHFHHLRVQPTGRNPVTGRSKWWVQAPTLDNGSDWYRNFKGDDSDPGLLIFQVSPETGFDLSSLSVL